MEVRADESGTISAFSSALTSSLLCLKVATSSWAQKVPGKNISLPVFPRCGVASEKSVP